MEIDDGKLALLDFQLFGLRGRKFKVAAGRGTREVKGKWRSWWGTRGVPSCHALGEVEIMAYLLSLLGRAGPGVEGGNKGTGRTAGHR
jgi:hypothetical protein